MALKSLTDNLGSQIPSILAPDVIDKAKEDGFQQTIDLLQTDVEELSDEISHSVEEVSYYASCIHFTSLWDTFKSYFYLLFLF